MTAMPKAKPLATLQAAFQKEVRSDLAEVGIRAVTTTDALSLAWKWFKKGYAEGMTDATTQIGELIAQAPEVER